MVPCGRVWNWAGTRFANKSPGDGARTSLPSRTLAERQMRWIMISIRNILYATDFSPYSNQAYFHAVALAEKYDAGLVILHVAGVSENGNRDKWRDQLEQIRPVNPSIRVRH